MLAKKLFRYSILCLPFIIGGTAFAAVDANPSGLPDQTNAAEADPAQPNSTPAPAGTTQAQPSAPQAQPDTTQAPDAEGKPAATTTQSASDAQITATIQKLYAETPDLNFYAIQVDTVDGVVSLKATVRYYKQRYRAIEMAESVPGVKAVNADELYFFQIP